MKLEVIDELPEHNSKSTPLLFIHGAHHGAWCWKDNFLPYFKGKGYPSYAISLRGHGESEGRDLLDSYSLDDYMTDVLKEMDKIPSKPILIGHSMGGAIVQKIMQLHENKIEAAILLASVPPEGMFKVWIRLFFTRFSEVYKVTFGIKNKNLGENINTFFSNKTPLRQRMRLMMMLQPESKKATRQMFRSIIKKPKKSQIPVLVLGSRDDWYFSEQSTMKMGKTYQATTVIFSDICHDMMLDPDWQIVSNQILAFIEKFKNRGGSTDDSARVLSN